MPVELTPKGTYGVHPPRIPPVVARFGQALVSLVFRLRGVNVVHLTTKGARTSTLRETDLIALRDGPDAWIVVASYAGSAQHPAWYFNMAQHPDDIWIEDGGRKLRVEASNLKGEAYEMAYARMVNIYKGYAGYREKTDREIPVVRLVPAA